YKKTLSCPHHWGRGAPRSRPARLQPTRRSPPCASYISLPDVLLSVSSYPFNVFDAELNARDPVVRILFDSKCEGETSASLQFFIILRKIEANNLEDVLRAILSCQEPYMFLLEPAKRVEYMHVMSDEHRGRIFGAEGRHLFQYVYEFRRNGVKIDLCVNIKHRDKHFGGNIRRHYLLEFLSKCRQVVPIQGQPRCILVPTVFFQQVAAGTDGPIQVESVYASR